MNRTRNYAVVSLVTLGLVLCGLALVQTVRALGPATADEMVSVTVTTRVTQSAIPVAARVSDKLTISLAANHTTGYEWRAIVKPNARVVELGKSTYEAPGGKILGAGGTEVWSFRPVNRGTTKVTLGYLRPWEKGVKPIKTQQFVITVR